VAVSRAAGSDKHSLIAELEFLLQVRQKREHAYSYNSPPPTALPSNRKTSARMRGKRAKQYRKLMQQYGLSFGFREPYQVLGMLYRH
jgi:hypothetical protein